MANNTKDENFNTAVTNAEKRIANSNVGFITLFLEEYCKIEPARPLAALFSSASAGRIWIKTSDEEVEAYIRIKTLWLSDH